MIDSHELESLARIRSDDGIVSLYLRFEPRLMYERGLAETKLKGAWKRFERRETSEKWKRAASRERERIEAFLKDGAPEARGLAIFACEPEDIWKVIPVSVPVPTWLGVDETTQTRPLTVLLDEFPRLAVCVVHRDRATLYVSEQRERELEDSVESEVPGKHSKGGWSQGRFERHAKVHMNQHLEEVVKHLRELNEQKPFHRLILAGTAEVTSETARHLPEDLRARLVDSIPVDEKHESENEILERARAASAAAEQREERDLVREIVDRAHGGGRGIVGLEGTLLALVEGRIDTLALTEDLEATGAVCTRCEYLAVSDGGACPACGGETELEPNVVDLAVERAFLAGAEINFLFDESARDDLAEEGHIGALLRF